MLQPRKIIRDNLYFVNKDSLELEYQYEYNQYKENEFTQKDTQISELPDSDNNPNEQSSYITLKIEKNSNYIYSSEIENIHLHDEKINELASYKNLPKHIDRLFNIPESFNSKKSYLTLDIDFNDLITYYDIFKTNEALRETNKTKRLCIDDSFIKAYEVSNKKSPFYSGKDDDIFENYNKVFPEDTRFIDYDFELNSGKFLGEYKSYNKKANVGIKEVLYNQEEENFFERFIGFYIVKYKKNIMDKENPYEKLASRFVKSSGTTYQNVKDIHVKYSQTYKYYIYPVYSLTIQSYDNNFYYDQALICGYPLITEDIDAIESVRPNYPAGPFAKILKDTLGLELEWKKPLERQEDIKGFQIFKRYNISEPFVLIQELRGHLSGDVFLKDQNIQEDVLDITPGKIKYNFVDQEFDTSKVNIYSICSIDAHGLVSDYSTQIGVVYDILLDKLVVDVISDAGAPIEYPNLLIPRKTKYFDNEDSIVSNVPISVKKNKFTLYFTPDTKKIRSEYITSGNHEEDLLGENSEFNLSIFRVNGQKNIVINNKDPKIKINKFS